MRTFTRISLCAAIVGLLPMMAAADHFRTNRSRRGAAPVVQPRSYASLSVHQHGIRGPQGPVLTPPVHSHDVGGPPVHSHDIGVPAYRPRHIGGGPPHAHLRTAICGMYRAYLHREAEPAGIQSWIDHICFRGGTLEEVRIGIVSSPECFRLCHNDPATYVDFLFANLKGCPPTPHELECWTHRFCRYRGNLNLFCRDVMNSF